MSDQPERTASSSYALGQLQRALDRAAGAGGAADLSQALEKMRRWQDVLAGTRRLAQPAPNHHAALIQLKNAAHAWRQAIFFLSYCTPAQQLAQVGQLQNETSAPPAAWLPRSTAWHTSRQAASSPPTARSRAPAPAGSWAGRAARTGASASHCQADSRNPPANLRSTRT